ncbi:MAG TPA: hypothetical protein VM598_02420 [Bdellovibrionota bacterium]|nr:hypothetical protein [Bdellovibrionota bacterium]
MHRTRTPIGPALLALLALSLVATGCKMKLLNTSRAPTSTNTTIIDPGGSADSGSVSPGYSLGSGGGIVSGGGVRLHVSIGEPTSGAIMTGAGVRAQIGVIGVLNGP